MVFYVVWAILASLQENFTWYGLHVVHASVFTLRYGKFGPIYRTLLIAVEVQCVCQLCRLGRWVGLAGG